ncbi:hypothetical protein PCANC_21966 [Puccinia coronata f. sp. avenae]|uniref:Uncharacterized protein n=1 Tax=Puccinia coronata f. sp. avenae TaxID=200324 RepID=A0A2N5SFA3_9BASI|nr:hypothetical protein PCANC_21966 [Puccinia coronata f. sp. avenae]
MSCPLESIIDLNKLAQNLASNITKLWTTYHLSPSNASRLGAVIPTGTHQDMLASVRTCPSFVIPISKSSQPKEPTPATIPFEMQYLQCDFVKQPACDLRLSNFLNQATTGSPTIPAMIPWAGADARQHYAPRGTPKISTTKAHIMILRPPQKEHLESPLASSADPLHHPLHQHADKLSVHLHVRESMYAQVLSLDKAAPLDDDNDNSKESKEIMDRKLAIEGRSMTSQSSSYSSCSPRNQLQ